MAESLSDVKKSAVTVKKSSSFKAESETQTAVAVRVPSLKKQLPPGAENVSVSEKLVTSEQAQNAAVARRRRIIAKNRAQNVRAREKTPEANRTPLSIHDDTTTTDEEDQRAPKAPHEAEADDIYAEMRRKLQEKTKEKDEYDIDIDKIREAQVEEAKERRRRSISPFALPTADEIANLQRKGSFIDPNNKLLTTVPNYGLCLKDDTDPGSRKNSLILNEADAITAALNAASGPTTPAKQNNQLITPPPPRKSHEPMMEKPVQKSKEVEKISQPTPMTKQTKPKSCIKTPTNATDPHPPQPSGTIPKEPTDVPPVRPKRSKSGTRSQVKDKFFPSKCAIM